MNKRIIYSAVILVVVVVASYSVWSYLNYLDYLNKTLHETGRWAVIMDSKGDIIAVETTSEMIWDQLLDLYNNKEERWIGGIIKEYQNKWGFHFKLDTIIIATVTIEGAQSYIQGISGDLDYWINTWTNVAYVMASVVEIHSS
jgi:hypothetical protein